MGRGVWQVQDVESMHAAVLCYQARKGRRGKGEEEREKRKGRRGKGEEDREKRKG